MDAVGLASASYRSETAEAQERDATGSRDRDITEDIEAVLPFGGKPAAAGVVEDTK